MDKNQLFKWAKDEENYHRRVFEEFASNAKASKYKEEAFRTITNLKLDEKGLEEKKQHYDKIGNKVKLRIFSYVLFRIKRGDFNKS